jgi:GT2 family glycosyltransferase
LLEVETMVYSSTGVSGNRLAAAHKNCEDTCDVSVVIVNWNTRALLRKCLHCVCNTKWPIRLETIVVDNNSNDGSPVMVSREYPSVRLLRNRSNVGFAKACNQAIRASTGRYLLLLNSDTEVCDGSISKMCEFMSNNKSVAAVGCTLLNSDGSVQRSHWKHFPSVKDAIVQNLYLYRLFPQRRTLTGQDAAGSTEERGIDVAHLLGACIMIRREVLDDIGLFDEGYFMYLEETDWLYRAKKKGWRVCYLPAVEIIHVGQQSSNKDPVQFVPYKLRSYLRFMRKHYGGRSGPAVKAAFLCGALLRLVIWAKRLLMWRDRNLARRMLAAQVAVAREICRL